ncbi:MAG: sporulation protein YqfD [Oscillospiraceae bacterium]|nr:sporulation protein YqfD [Oscillospiraceae bacterium]
MGVFRSLGGMVHLELTSADISGALAAINGSGIRLFRADSHGDLTIRFWVRRQDYRALRRLAEKRGESLKLLGRSGLYWSVKGLLGRPVLVLGMLLLLGMVLFVPSRVYFVRVEGNETVPARQILEAAENSGIRFGASRRAVRSERMKNELLSALPELQWAGVNTYGCVAVISVRERSVPEEKESEEGVCSIIAARDGIILSCTATKGNLLCTVGQAVQAGEVLISGFTDCGLTVTATRAEGEILAQTRRTLTTVTPSEHLIRCEEQSQRTKYSLILGKKRINFYKGSGIWDATCGKMYTEYHLTLPGGFQLPVTLVKEVYTSYDLSASETEEAEARLAEFAEEHLRQVMVAGTIVSADHVLTAEDGLYRLTGDYACIEMIGKVQGVKIGDYNG